MKQEKIITFGEIMLRLTPPNYQIIEDANHYDATFGGTEANVAISLSQFGHKTYFASKLPNNQLGEAAIKYLNANRVDTSFIKKDGSNLGIYFLEVGFGVRPSKVLYNRKNSSITTIDINDINIDQLLDHASWFHFSGISLALHDNVRNFIYELLKKCREKDIFVSFDSNFRHALWSIDEAKVVYQKIAPFIDLFFANPFDAKHLFGIDGEEGLEILENLLSKTNAKYVFGYQREVFSADENALTGYLVLKHKTIMTEPIRFHIFDRIGGGDAFAAGVIHGILKSNFKDLKFALQFGLCASVLKHTLGGDAFKLDEADVLNVMNRNSKEVRR